MCCCESDAQQIPKNSPKCGKIVFYRETIVLLVSLRSLLLIEYCSVLIITSKMCHQCFLCVVAMSSFGLFMEHVFYVDSIWERRLDWTRFFLFKKNRFWSRLLCLLVRLFFITLVYFIIFNETHFHCPNAMQTLWCGWGYMIFHDDCNMHVDVIVRLSQTSMKNSFQFSL